MISFRSDYQTGGHPKVMAELCSPSQNVQAEPGYGADSFTKEAITLLLAYFGKTEEVPVRFISGGTQTNLLAIDSMLSRTGAVIAAESGHINVHESGAIERSGHKIVSLKGEKGKLTARTLKSYLTAFMNDESNRAMPQPELVYISQPTELGTVYSLNELRALRSVIDPYGIKLYIDGARLATVLCTYTPEERQQYYDLCHAFSVGGTKCGALFGEALIYSHYDPKDIDILTKQHGALMAKGRVIAQQYLALFEDDLYNTIGKKEVEQAMRVKEIFLRNGFAAYINSPTNQQFFIIKKSQRAFLESEVAFEKWADVNESEIAIRLVTGWATTDEEIEKLGCVVAQMAK